MHEVSICQAATSGVLSVLSGCLVCRNHQYLESHFPLNLKTTEANTGFKQNKDMSPYMSDKPHLSILDLYLACCQKTTGG